MQNKSTTSQVPSKTKIMNWLKEIIPDASKTKIEQLGNGVVYCRLINHYFPNTISAARLINSPKNEYENTLNLKLLQCAATQLKLNIQFNVSKVCKQKFLQNWQLINSVYKILTSSDDECSSHQPEESLSNYGLSIKKTPKRAFEADCLPKGGSVIPLMSREMNYACSQNKEQRGINYNMGKVHHSSHCQLEGKWSVNSNVFRSNENAIVDRIKEILLKASHDIQKIRQIKMLLNIALEDVVKVEEEQGSCGGSVQPRKFKEKVAQDNQKTQQSTLLQPQSCSQNIQL